MTGSPLHLPWRRVALCLLLFVLYPAAARAQYEITLKLNKENYLTYEGVEATVSIMNRTGADVVLGGPNNTAWLSFEIIDPQQHPVPPMRFNSEDVMVFKAGSTITRKIALTDQFTFSEFGNYIVIANVYHPPSQQYIASNRARGTFAASKPFWSKPFGVPLGLAGAGQIRRYELSVLKDLDHTNLYLRLYEDKTNLNLATFSLGSWIHVSEPQMALDKENRLQVLFMTQPHIYAHVIIDTQGSIVKRLYYKEVEANRPHLVLDATQNVIVQGGEYYDPTIVVPTRPPGRSVKDRPPGL
ncbi:MAG: hypothetical protein K8R87_00020 [Verrucomicrobia bacterium]|nr:hypothetical protein [Verrucomicrobiota bacterium]